ncbi:hypothetical protein [Nocardia sp. alder85J]|uniref:hypothetical protein n=1 Tax=Nocardia sp. alder85J TaxID=2862949 RepID=UPI001CD47A38|nr:hypothetical protein [Nocardia sp. alder85J]MCX4092594.1 hypothetical protein [Nocardia sp. alder85J]
MTEPGRHRIEWFPGTDQLLGVCHCGATIIADDPIEAWQWLLGHPDGHHDTVPNRPEAVGDRLEPAPAGTVPDRTIAIPGHADPARR